LLAKNKELIKMGLFDFVSSIGDKIFGHEASAEEQAAAIQQNIEANNPGVKNLKVGMNEGVVSLEGEAESIEALEKTVLIAGNVDGVSAVKTMTVKAPDAPEVKYYEIQSGDSLSKIAKKFYGDAMAYPRIFDANKEVIKDPNLIYPGQKIRIPS
jgi:nucleoid-associated protein YgaU